MSSTMGRFGPHHLDRNLTRFRLWAPAAQRVELLVDNSAAPLADIGGGWFELDRDDARPGTRYRFRIDGDLNVPDPASHFQPDDIAGPSEIVDHDSYKWQCINWRGRPWHETVVYELHVGTFSEQGTYLAAIEHLDHLVATGVTAIELMPLADFSGRWNWGYDGVLLFAPDSAYGQPDDLKALIDAAHRRGLMVFLDVVYNHFGPEGNYLPIYAPAFFTTDVPTPWGAAIDYRNPEVRAFAVQNVLHWLATYRFDGLRFDAVHAIKTRGEPSILHVIADAAGTLARDQNRHIHLILENDDNSADLLLPNTVHNGYRAQWNDDYHHAWHVLLTNENAGYYEDYDKPFARLVKSLAEGFIYQGETSRHRGGAQRGQPSKNLSPLAFVNFLQNHDQIGNRPYGDRLETLTESAPIEAALAITLLAPAPPMLFMGEEWGSARPFPFFCDFRGELANAVEQGRRREFAAAYKHARPDEEPPSALDPKTFQSAKLDWPMREASSRYRLVKELLSLRQTEIAPRLAGPNAIRLSEISAVEPVVRAAWTLAEGSRLTLVANLSSADAGSPAHGPASLPLWGAKPTARLSPWQVVWWLERS